MITRSSILVGATGLVVVLSAASALASGHCRNAARDRGLAILSPLECPDPCDSPVGGRPCCVPYYPGYARPCRGCYNFTCGSADACRPVWNGMPSAGSSYGSYGAFTGARRDEANLLRLGGFSAPPSAPPAPATAPPAPAADPIPGYDGRP